MSIRLDGRRPSLLEGYRVASRRISIASLYIKPSGRGRTCCYELAVELSLCDIKHVLHGVEEYDLNKRQNLEYPGDVVISYIDIHVEAQHSIQDEGYEEQS